MSIDYHCKSFFNFCAAHLLVRLDIETKFQYFLFLTWSRQRQFFLFYQGNKVLRGKNKLENVCLCINLSRSKARHSYMFLDAT